MGLRGGSNGELLFNCNRVSDSPNKNSSRDGWLPSNVKVTDIEHHQLTGYEFESTRGDSEGQGSLACCSPWGRKESDPT